MPWHEGTEDHEFRIRKLEQEVRDCEESIRLCDRFQRRWEKTLETMRDQDYLREWVASQERREGRAWLMRLGLVAQFLGVFAAVCIALFLR